MPNRAQHFEKLKEKRRLARERAQKVQEERKRAREVKEEKWTTRNEFELVSEHRQLQRQAYIEKIRKEGRQIFEMAQAKLKASEEREAMIEKEIEEEVDAMKTFIEEQCSYYDDILKQISPPKERSVDEIVAGIEKELKEIYDIYESVFEFDPKMPDLEEIGKGKDPIFAKEMAQLEKEFAANTLKAEGLERQIAEAKARVETENVKCAAVEQEKQMELLELEKHIKAMEAKLEFLRKEPPEKKELEQLEARMAEELERNRQLESSLAALTKLIEKRKADRAKKKNSEIMKN